MQTQVVLCGFAWSDLAVQTTGNPPSPDWSRFGEMWTPQCGADSPVLLVAVGCMTGVGLSPTPFTVAVRVYERWLETPLPYGRGSVLVGGIPRLTAGGFIKLRSGSAISAGPGVFRAMALKRTYVSWRGGVLGGRLLRL